ncbi:hypothetical protein ACVWXL_005793 [Bradyrhizobium sp. GM22.5]
MVDRLAVRSSQASEIGQLAKQKGAHRTCRPPQATAPQQGAESPPSEKTETINFEK